MSKVGRKGDGRQSGREGEEGEKNGGGRRRKGENMSVVHGFPRLLLATNLGNRHK